MGSREVVLVAALAAAVAGAAGCIDGQPCPNPLEACDGVCRDLRSDERNCGFCGNVCEGDLACRAGACVAAPGVACPLRTGGAFVTLAACAPAQVVKLWSTSGTFVARAEQLAADPASPGPSVPVLPLVNGSDCDGQWSWNPVPALTAFAAAGEAACDVCPAALEADRASFVASVGRWCPSSARVVAVERR